MVHARLALKRHIEVMVSSMSCVAQLHHLKGYRISSMYAAACILLTKQGQKSDHVRPPGAMKTRSRMLQQYSGVYDPEDLLMLGKIFDKACAALPASMRTRENRTEIAKLVLARAEASQTELASLASLIDAIAAAA
ncbi:hypothetical protein [Bradyrhizobium sp. BWA-3-5]|uniref:hypothetical protein n=1 Tax=Bradyrhizobium sp. BWA-3-5 TaxID=3080013 RepID=UPI00293EE475|nr:hypothetical protein [Bradyrhizobium sp. BWA-3-5]WOH63840.1 hypothetical protein RX331_24505 [Bradyrhizobium sp. BWA-3-5]